MKMDAEKGQRQVLHRQTRELIFKVYLYFLSIHQQKPSGGKSERCDVASLQEKTAAACGVSLCTVQRVTSEAKKNNNVFRSLGKNPKRKKPVTDLDDFNTNVLKGTIFDMYRNGEYPTALKLVQKMKDAVGFIGGRDSMLRILKK